MIRRILYWLIWAVIPYQAFVGTLATASAVLPAANGQEALLPAYFQYSAQASQDLLGSPWDQALAEKELARLAERIRPSLSTAKTGAQVVGTFRRVLLEEEGFSYDGVAGNPENFLLGSVLARKRGNCLGLSMLYLALAEHLSVPFRGVCLPSHCFVRYEGRGFVRNVEFASGGEGWTDDRYRSEFQIGAGRPYLQSLDGSEMLGVFLKSLGAAYAKIGRDEDALRLYGEAVRFFPGFPEGHFNAGVSFQRTGRIEEAVARYRTALSLDPDLAPARDNLGIILALQGKFAEAIAEGMRAVELDPGNAAMRRNLASTFLAAGKAEEAVREFRKAVDLDPGHPRARAGLALSYLALGRYEEAMREFDKAQSLGVRFDPSVREALGRHRTPAHPES